jgi:hypothetical protein
MLAIQNHQPVLMTLIPDQTIDSNQVEIDLLDYFVDPDNDPLSFSVTTSINSLISANVVNSKLFINGLKRGMVNVTVIATDNYNSSVSAKFDVSNVITGIGQEFGGPGISVSPNPFDKKIKILFNQYESGYATLMLVDLIGKSVWSSCEFDITVQKELEIDGGNLPSGLYTCILFLNNKLVNSRRLIKH